VATAVLTVADPPLPWLKAIWVAAPAVPVAVNPMLPGPVAVAESVLLPAAVPRVQLVSVAIPLALVT
jgi:hypothetical protein